MRLRNNQTALPLRGNGHNTMIPKKIHGDELPAQSRIITVHLQDVSRLFDAMDPSPLRSKDLHASVVEHIVESAREFPARAPLALLIHVDQASPQALDDQAVCDAVRAYFCHLSSQARRRLRLHLRRGVISLFIGLAVLGAALVGSQMLGDGTVASTVRESLDIGGWVALWRPMEMFLYDWWPILGDRIFYQRLGRMPVQIQYTK